MIGWWEHKYDTPCAERVGTKELINMHTLPQRHSSRATLRIGSICTCVHRYLCENIHCSLICKEKILEAIKCPLTEKWEYTLRYCMRYNIIKDLSKDIRVMHINIAVYV